MRRRALLQGAGAGLLLPAAGTALAGPPASFDPPFPRVMGMNIGRKNYHEPAYQAALARHQVLVLDFFPGWRQGQGRPDPIGDALRALRDRNGDLLIGQYSTLIDVPMAQQDKVRRTEDGGWWLRNSRGERVKPFKEYDTFDANITDWAPPDAEGRRYTEWAVERDFALFHRRHPEFGFWYLDNSTSKPLVERADWDGDGRDESNDDPRVARAYRAGHARGWRRIRALQPRSWIVANTDDLSSTEYRGQLNGAYLEALYGKRWSVGTWGGWGRVMERYRAFMAHTRAPRLVGFGVVGAPDDFQLMRFGLGSCLLDDGYFSYANLRDQYSTAPWFDEFDAELGRPLEPPVMQAWSRGVFRRRFEGGMVLVNPGGSFADVDVGRGWRHLSGRQLPELNSGRRLDRLHLAPRDAVLLRRDGSA